MYNAHWLQRLISNRCVSQFYPQLYGETKALPTSCKFFRTLLLSNWRFKFSNLTYCKDFLLIIYGEILQGKKKEGNAARYVTRSQAIKILQVSLSDFRKLCIHKRVFPREPKKKVKGNHHTYCHLKDAMYILHDPLLDKFREIRAYQRKIKKAKAKKNDELAKLLLSRAPSYRLDMVIRDRFVKESLYVLFPLVASCIKSVKLL
ncbi:hypothetical protein ERO13_D13G037150v2 [Gossypium hirsutum]|nr:hypothetical protein ERO13_D13G037150v2 [Gossypium hirsutum]